MARNITEEPAKETTFQLRIRTEEKEAFRAACEANKAEPSEVVRRFMRNYAKRTEIPPPPQPVRRL